MFPNLYYLLKYLFGVEINILKIAATFGVLVAIAFMCSSYVLSSELKRKYNLGLLKPSFKTIVVGKPASAQEIFINFCVGFVFGYKILALLFTSNSLADPQAYLFSTQGNLLVGIATGLLVAGYVYYDANKVKMDTPQEKQVTVFPQDRVGDIVVYAFIFGFLGAKIFHNLENWSVFIKDPIGNLFSRDGLTFYGGLICAAIAIYYYSKKHSITFIHLCDAMAPTLMLAYAIGRIGCQLSGDGDWGIINSAFISSNADGKSILANAEQFNDAFIQSHAYYLGMGGKSLQEISHISVQPIIGLPNWLFGFTYPHNVVNDGVKLANCTGEYCNALPLPVFPTPMYESIISFLFFAVLMSIRKHIKTAGIMFGIYLMMNGFERFWIEKIRVNTTYSIFGFHPTQAEIISTLLFVGGLILVVQKTIQAKKVSGNV